MQIPNTDETVKRLQSHKGIQGVIVTMRDGTPLRSTMDNTSTILYVSGIKDLYAVAVSMIRDVDPTNELHFMRVRTKKYEILINAEEEYLAIVIQNPKEN